MLAQADGFLSVQSRHGSSASARQIMPPHLLQQGSVPVGVWDQLSRDWSACVVSSQVKDSSTPDVKDSFSVLPNAN